TPEIAPLDVRTQSRGSTRQDRKQEPLGHRGAERLQSSDAPRVDEKAANAQGVARGPVHTSHHPGKVIDCILQIRARGEAFSRGLLQSLIGYVAVEGIMKSHRRD